MNDYFSTMDNGFLLFNNVKIPHVNMLARFCQVNKETNQYAKPAMPSLVFGTMTWVRANIVLDAGGVLARGVTIATRYCAVRRQFQDRDADPHAGETQVLNYKMVQVRLLPLLASMYALHFTGRGMMRLYEENQSRMKAARSHGVLDPSSSAPVRISWRIYMPPPVVSRPWPVPLLVRVWRSAAAHVVDMDTAATAVLDRHMRTICPH